MSLEPHVARGTDTLGDWQSELSNNTRELGENRDNPAEARTACGQSWKSENKE